MNRVIVPLAAALVLGALAPAAAPARTTRWNLTAVMSGSYANAVTATPAARCAAHYAERVGGLKASFASSRPIAYDPVAHTLTGPLRYRIAGRWSVTGGYVAQVAQPDGTLACAATETPVGCGARVVFEDGHRTSTTGAARLSVDGTARGTIASRITAPRLTEQYADAGTPPAGWPAVCTLSPDDEALPATPLFGLSATEVLDRALATRIRLPNAKLRGHRRFTVRTGAARPNGCPAQGFDPCTERGSFGLRVTLTPAGR
jgi:hypothetical protein